MTDPTHAATSAPTRTLTVNGEAMQLVAGTLAEALAAAGFTEGRFATALNGAFVSEAERARTPVADGDAIEILTARQGG